MTDYQHEQGVMARKSRLGTAIPEAANKNYKFIFIIPARRREVNGNCN